MAICGHSRVVDYFAESVNSDGFIGIFCSPLHYSDLVNNKNCVYPLQKNVKMTPFAQKPDNFSRISLIKTFAASPFATNHNYRTLGIECPDSLATRTMFSIIQLNNVSLHRIEKLFSSVLPDKFLFD